MARLCILTPDPDYPEDWQPDAQRFRALFGETLAFHHWREPFDPAAFDLVMPLIAWGYHFDPAAWFAALDRWEADGAPLANPVPVLRWNAEKSYLLELQRTGVAIVPTRLAEALDEDDLAAARAAFGAGDLVVKPTVSGGAFITHRVAPGDPLPADARGRRMLIQPLMPAIATEGEISLFHFGGRFSHAVIKVPAAGDFRAQEHLGGTYRAIAPQPEALALAAAAIAAAPAPPLYSRSDMVRGGGRLRLMELELIEPSLYLEHAPDGGALFAQAVRAQIK